MFVFILLSCEKKHRSYPKYHLSSEATGDQIIQDKSSETKGDIQCSGSTGYCWCQSDMSDSKTPPAKNKQARPSSDEFLETLSSCKCAARAYISCRNENGSERVGCHVPECENNGATYTRVQTDSLTGERWCSNVETGEQESIKFPSSKKEVNPCQCQYIKEYAKNKCTTNNKMTSQGCYVPPCDSKVEDKSK